MDTIVVADDRIADSELALLIKAVAALRCGETTERLPTDWEGDRGRLAAELNLLADQCQRQTEAIEQAANGSALRASTSARIDTDRLSGFWLQQARRMNGLIEATGTAHECNRAIHAALTALRKGEGTTLPADWTGLHGKLADVFNDVVEQNTRMSDELARLSQAVGKEGRINERAAIPHPSGFWRRSIDSVNSLIADLVHPTSEVARVIGAVAQGDLSKSMALEADGRALEGEFLRTAKIINRMVEQLGTFSAEVTRVAREVGTEGKLGGQADVQGVAGTLEGPDRLRQLHGRQFDEPGAQYRRSDEGRGRGRLVEEDHGRCEGRNS